MKPLLVLRKTSVLPWYGHTKRCMGVLILVVDQGVDPPMGVFPNNNVIHRIEIQIFLKVGHTNTFDIQYEQNHRNTGNCLLFEHLHGKA